MNPTLGSMPSSFVDFSRVLLNRWPLCWTALAVTRISPPTRPRCRITRTTPCRTALLSLAECRIYCCTGHPLPLASVMDPSELVCVEASSVELLEFNWPLLLPKLGRMQPATTACAMLSCVALAASFCAFPGQMSFRRPTEQEAFAKALEGIAGGQLSALPVKQPAPRTTGRNWCWRWHRRAALAGALGASSAELSRILDFCHLVSSRCLPRLFLQDCA